MNQQEKIDRLAEKVMGWRKSLTPDGQLCHWETEDGSVVMFSTWNPFESWLDVKMLVERLID